MQISPLSGYEYQKNRQQKESNKDVENRYELVFYGKCCEFLCQKDGKGPKRPPDNDSRYVKKQMGKGHDNCGQISRDQSGEDSCDGRADV